MLDVAGAWWELQIAIKRLPVDDNAQQRQSHQQQNQQDDFHHDEQHPFRRLRISAVTSGRSRPHGFHTNGSRDKTRVGCI